MFRFFFWSTFYSCSSLFLFILLLFCVFALNVVCPTPVYVSMLLFVCKRGYLIRARPAPLSSLLLKLLLFSLKTLHVLKWVSFACCQKHKKKIIYVFKHDLVNYTFSQFTFSCRFIFTYFLSHSFSSCCCCCCCCVAGSVIIPLPLVVCSFSSVFHFMPWQKDNTRQTADRTTTKRMENIHRFAYVEGVLLCFVFFFFFNSVARRYRRFSTLSTFDGTRCLLPLETVDGC